MSRVKGSSEIGRRRFLRGAAGAIIALPFFESLVPSKTARAVSPEAPKRFIGFFSPNGTIDSAWRPVGGENSFDFGPILSPLNPHKSDLIILQNIDMSSGMKGPGDGHQRGIGTSLTGRPLNSGNFHGGEAPAGWASGQSVDQLIADEIGGSTKFRSLEFGVMSIDSTVLTRMSYRGGNEPVPPENDPVKGFDRIFGSMTGDPSALARLRSERKSVLDAVSSDFVALNNRLGAGDKRKLDAHLNAVRDIEKRLQVSAMIACKAPSRPTTGDDYDYLDRNDNFPAIGKLQMDLLVMALACDMTRVATLLWSNASSDTVFRWIDIDEGHHSISHRGSDDDDARDKLIRINQWYAGQFAYLLSELKKIPEGSGTLLDSVVCLWFNELGIGNSHQLTNTPFVLAGRCGGRLKTGRNLVYPAKTSHNDLLVSLCNAMDVGVSKFGDERFCTGPLPRLLT